MFWPIVIAVALGLELPAIGISDAAQPQGYATYAECDARLDQMMEAVKNAGRALPFPAGAAVQLKGSCIDVPPWQYFDVETKAT